LRSLVPNFVKPVLRRSRLAHRLARRLRPTQSRDPATTDFADMKRAKLERIEPLLKRWTPYQRKPLCFDFLDDALRAEFNITDTDNVSSFPYDGEASAIIADLPDGLILDCGAGKRPEYVANVVNFEICDYETTDVRGVGERLPFRDGVFDAVLSLQVLEHVRDPFACANEIVRVLKPGGRLYCVVPFLQPVHGFPNHYFNMSSQGLARLFEQLDIDRQEVPIGGRPIFTLTWMLQRWLAELPEPAREEFRQMRVGDLDGSPIDMLTRSFVSDLPEPANVELASATALFGRKKNVAHRPRPARRPATRSARIGR
jgi:SAM-dependent methyltransferase